ncbi:ribosomal protein S2 [Cavenderia fasciculata]|uniref:Small ribosomal subunit protein uS5 n=1 Tax=Cavenderia fasciculata TaxID=261658 RepID=F4PRF7_CACFS|nr:ribosomal protein S2 [Cavenderia fasciculata]EGG20509.1 ribosomal protein S2 [Cavenderia fasciculata]|eukprot:XP_004358359.1 ribosomal protein S2 [Cavenderia fasciculata]
MAEPQSADQRTPASTAARRTPGGDRRTNDRRGGAPQRGGARPQRGGRGGDDKKWTPVTKLGRLVNLGLIKDIHDIYMFSLPIKEHQIVDRFLTLKDEVMKIMPVQKQTRAGQRTRFKAFVVVGDSNGHVGLGVKCAKEVATAISGAIIAAKLSVIPVRRGYWGNKLGAPHTVPTKITGKCGSVSLRLVPAPRGTGIVAARTPKVLLQYAGVEDVYTSSSGKTRTMDKLGPLTEQGPQIHYCPYLWFELIQTCSKSGKYCYKQNCLMVRLDTFISSIGQEYMNKLGKTNLSN